MSDTPETDKEWGNWLHKLKMPIESFVDFARKLERERDKAKELAATLERYAELLGDELNDTISYAASHGWTSHRYREGCVLRDKIAKLKGETK